MEPVFKKIIANDTVTTDNEQEELEETPLTCWGCEQGILNQLGHMDEGGCLYDPDY